MKPMLMASLVATALAASPAQAQNGPELDVELSGDSASGFALSLSFTLPPAMQENLSEQFSDAEPRTYAETYTIRLRSTQDGLAAPVPGGNPPPGFSRDRMAGCFFMTATVPADAYATWTGGCDAEGFTTGAGILRYHYPTLADANHPAIFEGTVVGGMAEGPGVLVLLNGSRLEANFRYGLAEGQGRWLFRSGGRYEGEFRSGTRTGQARITFSDGVYEGAVVDGKAHGVGRMTWSDGSHYTGHFQQGQRHRQGTFVRPGEIMIEGLFRNGWANGRARVNLADGRCFIGIMQNDLFNPADRDNQPCE